VEIIATGEGADLPESQDFLFLSEGPARRSGARFSLKSENKTVVTYCDGD
jgi:hypothetical protein